MTIRVLGINCSPREKSNSRAALDVSLEYLKSKYGREVETDIINLKDHQLEHCRACDVCGKKKDTGQFIDCVIQDDMKAILESMKAADGFLVATPVYFGLASDIFSKFVTRFRLVRHQDFALVNRTIGIIAIAGRRSGGAETAIISSWLPFIRIGCLIVGNGDKTCQFGAMGWAGGQGHVLTDEWGLEQAKDTAERVFDVARLIKAGTQATKYSSYMKFSYSSGMRP